jgi:hypothetical protein
VGLLTSLISLLLGSLVDDLSSDSLLSDESLNLGGFVEGLVSSLDFSADNVLGDIVLLSESEGSSDGVGSLGTESSGSVVVSEAGNLTWSLDENLKSNDGKVGSADATSD